MAKNHFLRNQNINRLAASIANKAVSLLNHPVLILIDEIEQFKLLLPYLRVRPEFAHGPLTATNKQFVPPEYHASDTTDLVERFNSGDISLLIGTSCISIGTDIRVVQTLINLQGGKSEIQHTQSVGRGTRLVPGKTECHVWDFDVTNIEVVHRHALARRDTYEAIYPGVQDVDFG